MANTDRIRLWSASNDQANFGWPTLTTSPSILRIRFKIKEPSLRFQGYAGLRNQTALTRCKPMRSRFDWTLTRTTSEHFSGTHHRNALFGTNQQSFILSGKEYRRKRTLGSVHLIQTILLNTSTGGSRTQSRSKRKARRIGTCFISFGYTP